jgi:hypothetical protein
VLTFTYVPIVSMIRFYDISVARASLSVVGPPPEKWSSLRYGSREPKEDGSMSRKRRKPEEIVAKLGHVDVLVARGTSVADAICSIGVTEVG